MNDETRQRLRERLGDAPYVDITRDEAVMLGVQRVSDPHRGPVRITQNSLCPDTKPRVRRMGAGSRWNLFD